VNAGIMQAALAPTCLAIWEKRISICAKQMRVPSCSYPPHGATLTLPGQSSTKVARVYGLRALNDQRFMLPSDAVCNRRFAHARSDISQLMVNY
jgi:hypothetical protein